MGVIKHRTSHLDLDVPVEKVSTGVIVKAIVALEMIMALCLLVYNLGQRLSSMITHVSSNYSHQ